MKKLKKGGMVTVTATKPNNSPLLGGGDARRVGLRWLFKVLLLSLAAACAPFAKSEPTPPPASSLQFIGVSVAVTPQQNRVVITAWEGGDYAADVLALDVAAIPPDENAPIWTGQATPHLDYAVPYWVVYPTFTDQVGLWRLDLRAHYADGATVDGLLLVRVGDDVGGLMLGQQAYPSETWTRSDRPLLRLTTDIDPLPALYDLSIADALHNGRPSLIAFASPGLCSNRLCAPVVDSAIKPLQARYGQRLNVLHVEIYDLEQNVYIPAMAEWGLNYEPWTYLISAEGQIIARYDGPISLSELEPLIQTLLGG